jgi:hypothetical protein
VCRSDDADVDVVGAIAAHRAYVAELEHPEQLGLQIERHVADLVEQQCPAIGFQQQALAGMAGAGEASAHVAEELSLEKLLRNRGGVHGHERMRRAGAAGVDGASHELLTHSRFARNQHRRARSSHAIDRRTQGSHGLSVSEHLRVHGEGRGRSGATPLARMPASLERTRNDAMELRGVAWFEQVAERASLDGLHRLMDSPRRRDHDHR